MTQAITTTVVAAGRTALSSAPRLVAQLAAQEAAGAASRILFGPRKRITQGRPLDEVRLMTAGEGSGVPRVYGRGRVGGQVIWAGNVREETFTVRSTRGAKGSGAAIESEATEYRYSLSCAIALCEGPLARVGRVWADGTLINLGDYNTRIYLGTDDQAPDPLIESVEGSAPAYAGLAYIVFEDLPLGPFGNRLPQFNFEVERPLRTDDPHSLENTIRAVTMIPGSGEAVYATESLFDEQAEGVSTALNNHNGLGIPDAVASFDQLQGTLPNTEAVSLVVSWFGTDLRAGHCQVLPGVENRERSLQPSPWAVAGYDRQSAHVLSEIDGRPAYGGTPTDQSVQQLIAETRDRGLEIMLHPFILMDVPFGNGLTDPYGGAEQDAFPWRGRITADQLTDDGTAAVRTQVNAFFDSYAPMVRHYAQLAAEAGGVDRMLLGSELRGLTRLRDETGAFPAVERLIALAADVRAILPAARLSYAADWSEYSSYQPQDGSGDLLYPLDDLWADGNIDFIGIDNYMPLSDWRDGPDHLDEADGSGPYDPAYLESRIASGEGYDWYYASASDRDAQLRTPITDGAFGEPWVYRYKDIWSWWMNPHTPRFGGVKGVPTPWVPQQKPIVFTELGAPAIDKGPNQPNVFVDPKSAESSPPHYSSGERDDRGQRALLEAHHRFWRDPANNPVSTIYGGSMVDAERHFVYCWDARPFPDFPARSDVWSDAENWVTGHWLNGRAGRLPLSVLIETIAEEAGLLGVDASACDALVSGLTVPGPVTGREALEPLFDLFQLDAVERAGALIVSPRTGKANASIFADDLVDTGQSPPLLVDRVQDGELPSALSITYQDELSGFELKTTEVRDESLTSNRTLRIGTAVALEQGEAEGRARTILAEARAMTERVEFGLPEIADGFEPGDVIEIQDTDVTLRVRILSSDETTYRAMEAVTTDPGVYIPSYAGLSADHEVPPPTYGAVAFAAMDIPLLPLDRDNAHLWLAAFAEPWPGEVAVFVGSGPDATYATKLESQAQIGRLVDDLPPGHGHRWNRSATVHLSLPAGSLSSRPDTDILNGAHLFAVETSMGWELLQFRDAALQQDGTWRLSHLLRGRFGTEEEAAVGASAGARVVFLAEAQATALSPDLWGETLTYQAGPASALPGAFPYRADAVTLKGSGARPLSPVHLKVKPAGSQVELTWVRRTRIGGGQFGPGDVPLGETSERYQVTLIGSAGEELDRLQTTAPRVLFDPADVFAVEVAQLSTAFGAGRASRLAL